MYRSLLEDYIVRAKDHGKRILEIVEKMVWHWVWWELLMMQFLY